MEIFIAMGKTPDDEAKTSPLPWAIREAYQDDDVDTVKEDEDEETTKGTVKNPIVIE